MPLDHSEEEISESENVKGVRELVKIELAGKKLVKMGLVGKNLVNIDLSSNILPMSRRRKVRRKQRIGALRRTQVASCTFFAQILSIYF